MLPHGGRSRIYDTSVCAGREQGGLSLVGLDHVGVPAHDTTLLHAGVTAGEEEPRVREVTLEVEVVVTTGRHVRVLVLRSAFFGDRQGARGQCCP